MLFRKGLSYLSTRRCEKADVCYAPQKLMFELRVGSFHFLSFAFHTLVPIQVLNRRAIPGGRQEEEEKDEGGPSSMTEHTDERKCDSVTHIYKKGERRE